MVSKSASTREQVREASEADEAVVRRLFERVYSKGDLGLADELVAPNFVGYNTGSSEAYLGPEGLKTDVIGLRGTFHGFTVEIDDLHLESDTFEVSWTARGTHERRVLGIDPTCNVGRVGEEPRGNRIAVPGVATGTIRNGKIHENGMVWDVEKLRRQLGSSVEDAEPETGSRESNAQKPHLLERETL